MMLTKNDDASPLSAQQTPSSPSSVIRRDGLLDPREEAKFKSVDIPRRRLLPPTETQRTFPPPTTSDNKNLRRVSSDNLAQSKRDDPSVRRSIFGHYFKEKPRSYSAPHLERGQQPPPIPLQQQPNPTQHHKQQQTTTPKRSYKRSCRSSIGSLQPLPPTPERHPSHANHNISRVNIHDHPSTQVHPVDYRLFVPSEKQVAESAICCRYRELNKKHQKDYDSLLERQVQVEHSLPPFPSPLVRFCSDTTAKVAENDAAACSSLKNSNESRSYFASPDGEMHYHGVYSLLKPCSILKPSRYSNNKTTPASPNKISNSTSVPKTDSTDGTTTLPETNDMDDDISAPLSSFNFPRSYIETSAAILNQYSSSTDTPDCIPTDVHTTEGEEEKKENDHNFASSSSAPDISLLSSQVISESASSKATITDLLSTKHDITKKNDCEKDSEDYTEPLQNQIQNRQHFRFDPRVTVTEFEDPVPRKWYQDSELELHKREAIVLAQSYLRNHPAVAEWYRRAILDPITKTYRKRALFSLPVFSSTYMEVDDASNINNLQIAEHKSEDIPNLEESLTKTLRGVSSPAPMRQRKSCTPRVKKILVVHPNPEIASLFCKSMKSMFPSAHLVSTGSSEEASRLIEDSCCPSKVKPPSSPTTSTDTKTGFDIVIVEQHLNCALSPPSSSKAVKCDEVFNPLGFLDIFRKKEEETCTPPTSPMSDAIRRGSDLIHLAQDLSKSNSCCTASLLIGVSVRPERDAPLMEQAGADIVWGIPIPKVGEGLRNKLFSVLHAKRSGSSLPVLSK